MLPNMPCNRFDSPAPLHTARQALDSHSVDSSCQGLSVIAILDCLSFQSRPGCSSVLGRFMNYSVRKPLLVLSIVLFGMLALQSARAESAADVQLPLRNLDTHCPFTPPDSLDQWQRRAEELRMQIRAAVGLLPYPQLDPVQPRIYGRREMDGYSLEKCTFESLPGLIVTGTLYRPLSDNADAETGADKLPGVLCPHGHWANGRFHVANDVAQQLATGAERFESAAKNPMQARCVQLARMGCVVYQYDMLGYADSQQISFQRAHGYASQSAGIEQNDEGWLLYSPMAESHAQSVMGLQTLATMRTVDMLLTLPDVDPARIGITGASGGGTQTFIAAAIDPRISLAFPAVMVSTGMQGGCTCENACLLRTGTGNVELAALFAPKPLGLTAADDWTRTMPNDGFPQLRKIYELYDHSSSLALFPALHFGHNYNHVSRVSMYGWVNDHFGLGLKKPILESDFSSLPQEELTVWDSEHPQPEGGEQFERRLLKLWSDIVDVQMRGLRDGDLQQKQQLAQLLTDGWRVVLSLTTASALETQPATIVPKSEAVSGGISIQVDDQNQWSYQTVNDKQTLVRTDRMAAAFTYGYNLSNFARQAQQLGRSLIELSKQHPDRPIKISADGADAALAAAAVFCAEQFSLQGDNSLPKFDLVLSDPEFRFATAKSIRDPHFLPGSARYWDFPGLLSCLTSKVDWQ